MHKLKEKLMDELYMFEEKAEKSGNNKLSDAELSRVHKLSDTVKNFCKIDALEEGGGYSEESNWMADGRMYGTSYARGRGRNARRDSMGRYSREGGYSEEGGSYGGGSYAGGRGGQGGGGNRGGQGGGRGGSSYGGYSRDGGDLMERLEEMMEEASTTKERETIKRWMHEIDE